MPVDRALWKRPIVGGIAPPWPCPTCLQGKLAIKRDTLHSAETAESRSSDHDEGFDVRQIGTMFSALLECRKCKEIVACCGDGGFDVDEWQDEEGEFHTTDYPWFFPRYFTKPLRLFNPPEKVPLAIRKTLDRSFMLFFADHCAAANLIRQCVEEVMHDSGVSPTNKRGGFRGFEDRLKDFRKQHPEIAVHASALRYIGNFGSHPEALDKESVLTGYDILEQLLEERYVGQHRKTREEAARIDRSRRP